MNKTYTPRGNVDYTSLSSGIKVSDDILKNNEKLIDYYEGKRCTLCSMVMDVGEKGCCKYYRGDF